MRQISTVLILTAILSACSFSKHPAATNQPVQKQVVVQEKITAPTLEDILQFADETDALTALQNSTDEELSKFHSKRQMTLLDIVAERRSATLATYLIRERGASPFAISTDTARSFYQEQQNTTINAFVENISSDSLASTLEKIALFDIAPKTCLPILQKLFEMRWTDSRNDKSPDILTVLKSRVCSESIQNSEKSARDKIFAKEFMFQYSHGFKNFTVISTYSIRALIEYPSIYGVDPLVVLDLKARCMTSNVYDIWKSFIKKTLGWKVENFSLRLTTPEEIAFRQNLTAAGYMEQNEAECREQNKAEIEEIKNFLNIKEDTICE